jgi:thiol:disulfide interchange protein DsbA
MIRRLLLTLLLLVPAAALAADAPASQPLQEGVDYVVIADGKPFAAPVKGKVEVVEVFGYTCPHCAHFEPQVAAWRARRKDVNFVPLAAPFGGYWTPYAKAFYTSQELGVAARTHDAVFKAVHETGTLPRNNPSVGELATFYAGYGVDPARFTQVFDGPQVQARMDNARAFIQRSGVEGTPTLVVNGKYRIIGGRGFDDVLRIADALVAREKGGKR